VLTGVGRVPACCLLLPYLPAFYACAHDGAVYLAVSLTMGGLSACWACACPHLNGAWQHVAAGNRARYRLLLRRR